MITRTVDFDDAMAQVRKSPSDRGTVDRIAMRPNEDQRVVVDEARLSTDLGLEGDNWLERAAGFGDIEYGNQVTLMNSRFAEAITPEGQGWEIAGDQLYVDFDISVDNTPPGTRIAVGGAVIEISEIPHTGCSKFSARFGRDVLMSTRTDEGKRLRLRGVNARVVTDGPVRRGDPIELL